MSCVRLCSHASRLSLPPRAACDAVMYERTVSREARVNVIVFDQRVVYHAQPLHFLASQLLRLLDNRNVGVRAQHVGNKIDLFSPRTVCAEKGLAAQRGAKGGGDDPKAAWPEAKRGTALVVALNPGDTLFVLAAWALSLEPRTSAHDAKDHLPALARSIVSVGGAGRAMGGCAGFYCRSKPKKSKTYFFRMAPKGLKKVCMGRK